MKRIAMVAAAGLALVVAGGCAGSSRAAPEAQMLAAPISTSRENLRTITGVGTGTVRGKPDTLTMNLGVETRDDSADRALGRTSEQTEKLLQVLANAGVSKDDIQTSGLSVSPVFNGDGDKIIGYTSSNSVNVTTHDLDGAGKIIDAAASAVGDDIRIDGIWFSIEDSSELVKAARADAVKKASEQAQQLAAAAGVELAEIQTIEETTAPDVYAGSAEVGRDAAASPAPIEPGTQELAVSVTVVYRIG